MPEVVLNTETGVEGQRLTITSGGPRFQKETTPECM
jgi:hypothetical protein